MKICHLTSVHPLNDVRIFVKECQTLKENGFEVHYVVPGEKDAIINGIYIHGIEKVWRNRFERMSKTVRNVFKTAVKVNADIYHFHDPELIPIGLKLKKLGKIVIYDVHEDVAKQILNKDWLPLNSQKLISTLFDLYEKRSASKFDFVITATSAIRERFTSKGIKAIDINNYPVLKELALEEVNWEFKESSICYVGGINKYRGIEEMVNALEPIKNVRLNIAGNFSNDLEKERVKNLKGWNNVNELGFLNRLEVKELYKKSFAGLVVLHPRSNYIESLPVKMFEYMAAGVPVIASDFPLWKNIIEKQKSGLCVNPLDSKEIANAINYLHANPNIAEELGQNGRNAVLSEFNWEQESVKLIELYNNLLARKREKLL